MGKKNDLYHIIPSAAIGSTLTTITVTPFDVIKARMQVQRVPIFVTSSVLEWSTCTGENQTVYKNTYDAIIKISKNEGIKKLWKGLPISLMTQLPSTVIYYSLYETIKKSFTKNTSLNSDQVPFISGSVSRVMTTTFTCPFEFLRTSIQASSKNVNAFKLLESVIKEKGISTLWTGILPTLLRDVPFSAIYWGTYENTKKRILFKNEFLRNFLCGYVSGVLAAIITNPIDVVKTRMQASFKDTSNHYNTTAHSIKTIIQEDGFRGFTRGMGPRLLRIGPSSAIMISTYELSKKVLFNE